MSIEKAEELVQQSGWFEWYVPARALSGADCDHAYLRGRAIGGLPEHRDVLSTPSHGAPDAGMCLAPSMNAIVAYSERRSASTLLVDISTLLRQFASSAALAGSNVAGLSPKAKLEYARALLSVLLTFGVSEGIDSVCTEGLSVSPYPCAVGLTRYDTPPVAHA